jgi:general secretion pathway protein E
MFQVAGEHNPQEFLEDNASASIILKEAFGFAIKNEASDLHIKSLYNGMKITTDIFGKTKTIREIKEKWLQEDIIICAKKLSNMEPAKKLIRQSRAFTFEKWGVRVRAECTPGYNFTNNLCFRFIYQKKIPTLGDLVSFGMKAQYAEDLAWAVSQKQGLILITGATASGKSTTLQAAMMSYNREERTTLTLEDPVERTLPDVVHAEINPEFSWTEGIKGYLRMAPKVILIGEIRDSESAHLALEAAQTGHLVLSTLHTNSVENTITRLLNLGVEENLLKENLLLVANQQIRSKLCPHCRIKKPHEVYWKNPDGCTHCQNVIPGYQGIIAITEYAKDLRCVDIMEPEEIKKHLTQSFNHELEELKKRGVLPA